MNTYRIAVCDDEKYYSDELVKLLSTFENESKNEFKVEVYTSGEELLEDWKSKVFHIIILDVEMTGKSGIDVARDIRKEDENVVIIFATGHENYAFNAFDVSAMGYLVKPVSYERLKRLLTKAIISVDYMNDKEAAKARYIEVKAKYEKVNIEVDRIQYIEKRRNQCVIHTKDNEYCCYDTLSQLMETLDIHKFIYIHQGYVVNFDMIKEVAKTSVILQDYIEVPISRKYYKEIRQRFMNKIYKIDELTM